MNPNCLTCKGLYVCVRRRRLGVGKACNHKKGINLYTPTKEITAIDRMIEKLMKGDL